MLGNYGRTWPEHKSFAEHAQPFIHLRIDSTIEYGYSTNWVSHMMCKRTYEEMTRELGREPTLVECALHWSLIREEDVVRIADGERVGEPLIRMNDHRIEVALTRTRLRVFMATYEPHTGSVR